MTDYAALQKTLIKKALLLALVAACICLAFNLKTLARGIALGALFGVAEFKLMALLLRRRMTGQGRMGNYAGLLGRFLLLSIPLIVAIKLPSINFAATVGGIFSVKAAIFYHFFLANRLLPDRSHNRSL